MLVIRAIPHPCQCPPCPGAHRASARHRRGSANAVMHDNTVHPARWGAGAELAARFQPPPPAQADIQLLSTDVKGGGDDANPRQGNRPSRILYPRTLMWSMRCNQTDWSIEPCMMEKDGWLYGHGGWTRAQQQPGGRSAGTGALRTAPDRDIMHGAHHAGEEVGAIWSGRR